MELKNLLKGLRPAVIGGIAAERVSLSSKRLFHLVCSSQSRLYISILAFHDQYSRIRDCPKSGNKRGRESVLELMMGSKQEDGLQGQNKRMPGWRVVGSVCSKR